MSNSDSENAHPLAQPAKHALFEQLATRVEQEAAWRITRQLKDRFAIDQLEKLPEEDRGQALEKLVHALPNFEAQLEGCRPQVVLQSILDDVLLLGPLEPVFRMQSVSDILVNSPDETFVEIAGNLIEAPVWFRDANHIRSVAERVANRLGRRLDNSTPLVDARLPDGSRFHAVIPPIAARWPTISIRRFSFGLTLEELLKGGSLSRPMAEFLLAAVRGRLNIVVSGGTGSGKTTLLNILAQAIPVDERIITIEDTLELRLNRKNLVALESRAADLDGRGEITQRILVRNSLRMRPNRIIVGEVRGAEASDMLQAMNTGHAGSLTTLHANSPRDVITRLETLLMMAELSNAPIGVIRRQIATTINLFVHVERVTGGGRCISRITESVGMEGDTVSMQELFHFEAAGLDDLGRARGTFLATGIRPRCANQIERAGIPVPVDWFLEAR